jgi:hypothetical protein
MQGFTPNHSKASTLFYLKAGCLFFWACWFTLACTTNILDLILAMGKLSANWHFHSGNYTLLARTLSIYSVPAYLLNILFMLDISVQGLSAILFFLALSAYLRRKHGWLLINSAFTVSIALWAVFIIMEEIFIAYQYESVHIRLFMFELLTLLTIHSLPQE